MCTQCDALLPESSGYGKRGTARARTNSKRRAYGNPAPSQHCTYSWSATEPGNESDINGPKQDQTKPKLTFYTRHALPSLPTPLSLFRGRATYINQHHEKGLRMAGRWRPSGRTAVATDMGGWEFSLTSPSPPELWITMLCSLPVCLSLAPTCKMPSASMSNETSICGTPLQRECVGDGNKTADKKIEELTPASFASVSARAQPT